MLLAYQFEFRKCTMRTFDADRCSHRHAERRPCSPSIAMIMVTSSTSSFVVVFVITIIFHHPMIESVSHDQSYIWRRTNMTPPSLLQWTPTNCCSNRRVSLLLVTILYPALFWLASLTKHKYIRRVPYVCWRPPISNILSLFDHHCRPGQIEHFYLFACVPLDDDDDDVMCG